MRKLKHIIIINCVSPAFDCISLKEFANSLNTADTLFLTGGQERTQTFNFRS